MNVQIRLTALTFVLALAAPGINDAKERLTIVVSPSRSMAPATIRVRLGVEPAMENRVLNVVADSGDFYRSSEIPLDGERAPHSIAVEFRGLPSGTYVVRGVLQDDSGHPCASVYQEVTVFSPSGDR